MQQTFPIAGDAASTEAFALRSLHFKRDHLALGHLRPENRPNAPFPNVSTPAADLFVAFLAQHRHLDWKIDAIARIAALPVAPQRLLGRAL